MYNYYIFRSIYSFFFHILRLTLREYFLGSYCLLEWKIMSGYHISRSLSIIFSFNINFPRLSFLLSSLSVYFCRDLIREKILQPVSSFTLPIFLFYYVFFSYFFFSVCVSFVLSPRLSLSLPSFLPSFVSISTSHTHNPLFPLC